MARTLPRTDAVIVGFGWTGAIAAKELTDAGLSVVALERGPAYGQDDFATRRMHDGLTYSVRGGLATPLDRVTLTFRNNGDQTALPMRRIGSFNPSQGFGGSGNTWSGHSPRAYPSDFVLRSHYTERYGADIFPEHMTSQDWGVTWDEVEPGYDRFEKVAAVSGTAGNVRGERREGGNPYEGERSDDFPLPAFERNRPGRLFIETAQSMGLNPFPVPVANASEAYTNAYGVEMGRCVLCGHCPGFACAYQAKGSPVNSVIPAIGGDFEARSECEVLRIERAEDGRTVTGVTYLSPAGEELFQPADIVILGAYAFENVRLLLLSGIGAAYDPATGEGVVGRNYSYQTLANVEAFFEGEAMNPQIAGGSQGTILDDYQSDNFDHAQALVDGRPFIGGGFIGPFNLGADPITYHPTAPGSPPWGAGWKEAVVAGYQNRVGINVHASVQSYRGNYLDLDPTYRDAYGRPLLRMTFDFPDNEQRMMRFLMDRAEEIAREMGASQVRANGLKVPYDITVYQTTHNVGGTAMGADPGTSVVNTALQHWDAHNLFVLGGSVFPQNVGVNPTPTIAALAYHSLGRLTGEYLSDPRPLDA
ncbi:GMC family oxidoreductase [Jannaschia aquimarina]|uniref:Gluconate 2-dehydrogenase flavoprotein n=1 Tax=Jannaschia aquimarina TaxID=935700 RepID=A0A0D1CQK5_9RHOB|nr:GMC family oxidoreductase [Jannaschia aquimarina]KIT17067.1 Gluconate 2-dehydrogenase flavoprotein precursor [Jannaschia aquimarina]SNS82670.1 gluconate 2-dehydrogenase alpha chain [Jannaschia aquimarina]